MQPCCWAASHHTCCFPHPWVHLCDADGITQTGNKEQSFGNSMYFPVGFSFMLNNPMYFHQQQSSGRMVWLDECIGHLLGSPCASVLIPGASLCCLGVVGTCCESLTSTSDHLTGSKAVGEG